MFLCVLFLCNTRKLSSEIPEGTARLPHLTRTDYRRKLRYFPSLMDEVHLAMKKEVTYTEFLPYSPSKPHVH